MTRGLVVHEWIERSGGSERVLDHILDAVPDADLLCLWSDADHGARARHVDETWLARTPLRRSKVAALPLMPATWARTDARDYEWSLASTHLFAHHVGGERRRAATTYAYVHTPARYIWVPEMDERGRSAAVRRAASLFKAQDRRRAGLVDRMAANSEFVRQRIADAWQRDSTVIHPPVDVRRIVERTDWRDALTASDEAVLATLPDTFVLGASRFVPYKRLDLVVRAGESIDTPVVLAGGGPQQAELEALGQAASVPVHFVDRPSDELLLALYQRALVYVFPAVEDFGIMPVEAMAAGARVVVADVGGTTESVVDDVTGAHVSDWQGSSLARDVGRAVAADPAASRRRALDFDATVFRDRLDEWMGRTRG